VEQFRALIGERYAIHLAVLRAIFPLNPLNEMGRTVSAHRFAEGREGSLFAEAGKEPEALQLVLNRILHLGETKLDAGGMQGVVEFADDVGCGDVHARDRLRRDHQPADGRG